MDLTQLLAFTMQNKASDLHLSPANPAIIRVHGKLRRIKSDAHLSSDDIRSMLYSVMTEQQRADFEKDMELDFAISFGEKARFRVNAFTTRNGCAAVFRTIPSEIPSFEDLDLPEVMRRFAELDKGLVLVCGATGSGKSTTISALVNHINQTMDKHIITIEDPVEFVHHSKRSLVNHREVGRDTTSFSRALKSALREDPDVILVGELRDYETMSLALTAAETGHLVLASLHANTAPKAIDRILDVFPAGDKPMARTMLSSSLQGVVAQNLLPKADGGGRVGAFEILVGTSAVRNLIRENQIPQIYSMIQTGLRYGMTTMEDYVTDLVDNGIVTKETARAVLSQVVEEGTTEVDSNSIRAGGGKPQTRAPEEISTAPSAAKPAHSSAPPQDSGGGSYSF
ncbi:MAG: type IV pili twitching motility protein PilT [Micavibrio aeruginosavorus]|uniref:Type IV pili twitching motility protein PilT n=1 Tax=Micavibrio aeruginosavorus TaxID=349221 RepID=A0A2W4ZHW4_9BACT|nr:MAG: type IV pili twitching motility protein PilT [Micavibrio aeruginosavorus]